MAVKMIDSFRFSKNLLHICNKILKIFFTKKINKIFLYNLLKKWSLSFEFNAGIPFKIQGILKIYLNIFFVCRINFNCKKSENKKFFFQQILLIFALLLMKF